METAFQVLARGEKLQSKKPLKKHLEEAGVYEPIKLDKEEVEALATKAHSTAKNVMELDK